MESLTTMLIFWYGLFYGNCSSPEKCVVYKWWSNEKKQGGYSDGLLPLIPGYLVIEIIRCTRRQCSRGRRVDYELIGRRCGYRPCRYRSGARPYHRNEMVGEGLTTAECHRDD